LENVLTRDVLRARLCIQPFLDEVMAMLAEVVRSPVVTAAEPRAIQRVLVAFDGSPGAWAALEQAIAVAVSQRALLTIAGVVGEPTVWLGYGPIVMPYTREQMLRTLERDMQRKLAAARDEVPATVSVTTQLLHGRPARVLSDLAESGSYDLVVAGPRKAGFLRRLFGGSVTHSLLTRSSTSVLAVKG
jgi:nucleotide-binding universal stress UspA family protein